MAGLALVVLPGLDATGTLHDGFLEAARERFDSACVLAYPRDVLDYAALERWVRGRLPEDTPFVLLGESFSGPVAIAIAAKPPRGLRGMVLSTSFARAPVPWLARMAPLIRRTPLPVPPTRMLLPFLLGRWSTRGLEHALGEAVRSVPSRVLRFRAALALQADASDLLASIAVPTLCLRATQDRLLSRSCANQILASIPGSIAIDVCGPHLLLQAAATACARAVGDFGDRVLQGESAD